jgi:hypothetical protein
MWSPEPETFADADGASARGDAAGASSCSCAAAAAECEEWSCITEQDASRGHFAARFGAATTGFGARLAVCHAIRVAFLRAPIANVCAQLAELLGEGTVASDRIAAQPADRRALDAARRAGALALLAGHMRKTMGALVGAIVACVDAVLFVPSEMFTHDVASFVKMVRECLCPYCFLEFLMMAKTRNTMTKTPTIGHTPYPPIMPDP